MKVALFCLWKKRSNVRRQYNERLAFRPYFCETVHGVDAGEVVEWRISDGFVDGRIFSSSAIFFWSSVSHLAIFLSATRWQLSENLLRLSSFASRAIRILSFRLCLYSWIRALIVAMSSRNSDALSSIDTEETLLSVATPGVVDSLRGGVIGRPLPSE